MERRRFFLSALAALFAPVAAAAKPNAGQPMVLEPAKPQGYWREVPIVYSTEPVGGRVV